MRNFRLFLVFPALCIALQPAAVNAGDLTPEQTIAHPEVQGALKAIDAWIEGTHIYDRVPGMSAGIVYDQQLIWTGSYGHSNLETERPADSDTLYSICSISKLFTSIGIMQLRDDGKAVRIHRHSGFMSRIE